MIFANRTRYSPSILRRLLREGKIHLILLYAVLRLSDAGREAIENSGSYRFADHIYLGKASGRLGIGRLIDRLLLSLPSSRSFRNRFFHVQREISARLRDGPRNWRVLSVPAGIPTDLIRVAGELRERDPSSLDRITFFCLDKDPGALDAARSAAHEAELKNFTFIEGDALDLATYPEKLDLITSTGLAEFLSDEDVIRFYTNCWNSLVTGGELISSATMRHRLSAYLMEELAELLAHYRNEDELTGILQKTPFGEWKMSADPVGYQVLFTAKKGS